MPKQADSDPDYVDVVSVGCQSLQVARVRGEHRTARLSESDNQSVHRGAPPSVPSQDGGASRECFRDGLGDVAALEKSVLASVTPSVALQAFDEDNSRHERWPEPLITERGDERHGVSGPLGKTSDATRVKKEDHVNRPCGVGLW